MAKSNVIKELANNEISLEVALNRLFIIASDIGNETLVQWANKELTGYSTSDVIPFYRIAKNTVFRYSGINGNIQVTNASLPLEEIFISKGKDTKMFDMNISDSIKSIEDYINAKDHDVEYYKDVTWAASLVHEITGINFFTIKQIIPINVMENALNEVKTLILKIFIQLDKSFGCLDNLDIDIDDKRPEDISEVNTIVNNYIITDNRIQIGDKNKIKKSDILTGENHI